jgi:Calcineurin-like phosphoesterase
VTSRIHLWLCLAAALAGCNRQSPVPTPVPELPADQRAISVYLIGDAGAPNPRGEPVFHALRGDLLAGPARRVVVFLGDNVYPRGLPAPADPERRVAERRLLDQANVVTGTEAQGYFVPGNHDWDRSGKDGWAAARRQEHYLDSISGGVVSLYPRGGCPGPSVVDIDARLRLILLNTEWWLHSGPKPVHPSSNCSADTEGEVIDSLAAAVQEAGPRLVVVAGHHPLASGGEHGGYFGWRDHLFPLLQATSGLWIPLPLIGSLYPTARQHGISSQDLPSPKYQNLIAGMRQAFKARQPTLYAAGHEHSLQVIAGGPVRLQLVSGAGYFGHSGRVVPIRGTLFAKDASGFARLDIPQNGRARLAVLQVDASGRSQEVFSTWVE